jgi:hypothetical protein
VKEGMILEMAENVAPWATVPKFFQEITKKNHETYGKPVVDENAVIYTKDGKTWPGGTPYPEPTNALEVVANIKYERVLDDFYADDLRGDPNLFVNKEGKTYKTQKTHGQQVGSKARLTIPPLGSVPGMEKEFYRVLVVLTHPREIKGTGQLQIKHWDNVKNPDKGFAYVPAFKRILRISATTYQDNMGGGDFTWGDLGGGYEEPTSNWKFTLAGKKNMLMPAPFGEKSIRHADGTVDPRVKWDEGKRFPRDKWVVMPVYVVESTPKIKHIYGKRIMYVPTRAYSNCFLSIMTTDYYDRQLALWKGFNMIRCTAYAQDEPISFPKTQSMYDLQARHTTHILMTLTPNIGTHPAALTLKLLIARGR